MATPSTEMTPLLTPATLLRTTPVITIASASHGPLIRAARGTERIARITAATAASPITSDARPAPPTPTRPARVTS